jgi:hypothetical protein
MAGFVEDNIARKSNKKSCQHHSPIPRSPPTTSTNDAKALATLRAFSQGDSKVRVLLRACHLSLSLRQKGQFGWRSAVVVAA